MKCKQDGSPWSITLRWIPDCKNWRITTFKDIYEECPWAYENSMVKASLLAKRRKKKVKSNSTWTMSEFKEKVCTDDEHFTINQRQAYKVISLTRVAIKSDLEDNFNIFWSYYLEIQKTNPNTTPIIKLSNVDEQEGKKYS